MNKTGVLVINLNTLSYTRNYIKDLLKQNVSFDLTLIDQASDEEGIKELFNWTKSVWGNRGKLVIKYNTHNEPLNNIWNKFAQESSNEYLCYLNNDVRIPSNFIKDSEYVFMEQPSVGITVLIVYIIKYHLINILNKVGILQSEKLIGKIYLTFFKYFMVMILSFINVYLKIERLLIF